MTAKESKTIPLNNNVLVEVLREDDGVSRTDENESMQYGRVIAASICQYHLTASSAIMLEKEWMDGMRQFLGEMVGSIVRWEEFAEGGQTFEEDGKKCALIPWWRLIGVKE